MSYSKDEQKTMTELGTEQFSSARDINETSPDQNIEKTSYIDTVITSTPAIQALTRIRTKAKCVETILRKAVIEPYQINGQTEGLRITGLDKILLARDLLLKSGDIIRAVNGHPLNSKRRAYEIFKKARKLPTMKIELLRDGKTETLLYYLR
jgi:type II secretory pathway component PulC